MESYGIFKSYSATTQSPPSDFCIVNEADVIPEEALQKVGARTYYLRGHKESVRIFLFGCQGDKFAGQDQVAQLMNDVASRDKPDFALVLGDNIYENGAQSPFDDAFKTLFDDVYLRSNLPYLRQFPYFLILGNHDGNYHKKAAWTKMVKTIKQGREVEKNQVIKTYLTDKKYGDTAEKIDCYQQDYLDLHKLQPWNMPYFFYSLIIGNVQIFCINSNSYPLEYLEFLSGEFTDNNQAAWLAQEYFKAKESGRKIILALHHPLHTEGKRTEPEEFDAYQYFTTKEEIALLNKYLGTNTQSYNELLRKIFIHQKMHFDLILAAHDHYLSYYNNFSDITAEYPIRQIKPAGGGGKLQKRVTAKDHPYVACCLENFGFADITFSARNPDIFEINIYSTEKHHLKFDNKSHVAICNKSNEDIEKLRYHVLSACHEYLCLLRQQEMQQDSASTKKNDASMISYLVSSVNSLIKYIIPYPIKIKEIAAADDLRAYFNQYTLPHLEELVKYIINIIDSEKLKLYFVYLDDHDKNKILNPQFENSFFFILFKKMMKLPDDISYISLMIKSQWERLIQSPSRMIQPIPLQLNNRM